MSTREVLCGHCAAAPATETCAGCKLEICAGCIGDRRRCPSPRGLEIRLGLGARLRAVDPGCRWGLATTLTRSLWRIDLERLERSEIDADVSAPEILASGELSGPIYDDSVCLGYRHGSRYWGALEGALDRSQSALIRAGDQVAVIHLGRELAVGFSPTEIRFRPFPRATASAAGYDAPTDRLACATFGVIAIWQVEERRRIAEIEVDGFDVRWVAIAGDTVAALMSTGGGFVKRRFELVLWSADGVERARVRLGDPREPLADLSADGRVAIAADDRSAIVVVELGATGPLRLGGHSDGISALRITGDGSRIASGDFDNRVILRDRGASGFPEPLAPAELAVKAVPGYG